MKRCPYCGAEYPDDAEVCTIDRQPLPKRAVDPPPSANRKPVELAFPDYKWSARDVWKYFGTMLVLGFILSPLYWALRNYIPGFHNTQASGLGYFSWRLLDYGIDLLVAAYFARTETLASFWRAFGLDRKPSNYVWFGVVAALGIRTFGVIVHSHGWSRGVGGVYDLDGFNSTSGPERYLFLAPMLLLAPLFEEVINRGFLYEAFRGSFSVVVSTLFIIGWTAVNHWSYYSVSWIAALDLSLLTIVQCYLREKSDSLWDCIFCHLTYNWSLLFLSNSYY